MLRHPQTRLYSGIFLSAQRAWALGRALGRALGAQAARGHVGDARRGQGERRRLAVQGGQVLDAEGRVGLPMGLPLFAFFNQQELAGAVSDRIHCVIAATMSPMHSKEPAKVCPWPTHVRQSNRRRQGQPGNEPPRRLKTHLPGSRAPGGLATSPTMAPLKLLWASECPMPEW